MFGKQNCPTFEIQRTQTYLIYSPLTSVGFMKNVRYALQLLILTLAFQAAGQNDMQILGPASVPPPFINSDAYITYLVRFHNVSGNVVQDVMVTDTFDSRFDLSTLTVIHHSHPYEFWLDQSYIVRWVFKNINLPDHHEDSTASKGFILFKIRPKPFIESGQVIPNRVYISFDQTKKISTPVMFVLIDKDASDYQPDVVEIQPLRTGPNPSSGSFLVFHRFSDAANCLLTDAAGRMVWSGAVYSGDRISLGQETSGIYFLYLQHENFEERAAVLIQSR